MIILSGNEKEKNKSDKRVVKCWYNCVLWVIKYDIIMIIDRLIYGIFIVNLRWNCGRLELIIDYYLW